MVNLWISCAEYTLNIQRFLLKLIEFGQDSQRRLTCETLSLQILFLHFHVSRKGDLPHLISEPLFLTSYKKQKGAIVIQNFAWMADIVHELVIYITM